MRSCKLVKKVLSVICSAVMILSTLFGVFGLIDFNTSKVSADTNAVSTFDDGYELKANWIWANTPVA